MEPIRMLPYYTYTDYLQWEGKWEIIGGIPYAMSPAPRPLHQLVASNLNFALALAVRACEKCKVYQPIDYKISEDTVVQPDLLVVCEQIEKQFLYFPPALIAEILFPATASKDRLYKQHLYQQQSIPYYLIVDPEKEEIEIYELHQGKYALVKQGKTVHYTFQLAADCQATVDFKDIWK